MTANSGPADALARLTVTTGNRISSTDPTLSSQFAIPAIWVSAAADTDRV